MKKLLPIVWTLCGAGPQLLELLPFTTGIIFLTVVTKRLPSHGLREDKPALARGLRGTSEGTLVGKPWEWAVGTHSHHSRPGSGAAYRLHPA